MGEGLKGEVPDPSAEIQGCNFGSRCPYAAEICKKHPPELEEINQNHTVSCHRFKEIELVGVS